MTCGTDNATLRFSIHYRFLCLSGIFIPAFRAWEKRSGKVVSAINRHITKDNRYIIHGFLGPSSSSGNVLSIIQVPSFFTKPPRMSVATLLLQAS